ncbi:hypothetical protein GCM10023198_07470 [Promicromonospora umidemergens]|uniref:Uncharacterized protein n=1 Tax=Promicromonospora umidemergens TaxID=629679 RepID=A0ABP8WKS1_9MICO
MARVFACGSWTAPWTAGALVVSVMRDFLSRPLFRPLDCGRGCARTDAGQCGASEMYPEALIALYARIVTIGHRGVSPMSELSDLLRESGSPEC